MSFSLIVCRLIARNDNSYEGYGNPGFNPTSLIKCSMLSKSSVTGYYSDSQWNKGMKWAFLAACNQLTHSDQYKRWAATLLGKQSRAHGVLGYDEKAPRGPGDYNIVNSFFQYSFQNSMIQAWFSANLAHAYTVIGSNGKAEWKLDKPAAVVHYQYRNEKFSEMYTTDPGTVSSRFDASDIRRYYNGSMNTSNSITLSSSHIQAIADSIESKQVAKKDALLVDDILMLVDRELNLDKKLSLAEEQVVNLSLCYALENDMLITDDLKDWKFSVSEIVEEKVDVLEIGIDAKPTVVGYMVMAYDPNDESSYECVIEDGLEELRIKNCFSAMIDGSGVCSVSLRIR